ncbi:MAG: hypothetical protein KGQ93_10535 [Cyanobacteria bacterium REEB459]|nr:hypothetical protein [Cyanobacteria bacterium REEB459]
MVSEDSLDGGSSYSVYSPNTAEEEVLYQYFQHWRRQESAHQLLERFRSLFLEGNVDTDHQVGAALFGLSTSQDAEHKFKYVLNRCCYILINYWYGQSRDHWAIPELIALFDDRTTVSSVAQVQRVRALLRQFLASEQYVALDRLRRIFLAPKESPANLAIAGEQPLASRIRYYPFLYDTSLLTQDSGQEQAKNIGDLRLKAEANLGICLARYHNYGLQTRPSAGAASNPTLLEASELTAALNYYTGKVDQGRTQKDSASWFQTYSKTARCFRDFKDEFVDYLIAPIAAVDPRYSNNTFTRNLRQHLRDTMANFDDQQLSRYIHTRFCQQVLNFLVVDNPQRPVFRRFCHLLEDIGYTLTIGLLLRVVLFCSEAKPWLERRFSVLFNLHEQRLCKDVPWLVQSLEHLNIALVTNFNQIGYQF